MGGGYDIRESLDMKIILNVDGERVKHLFSTCTGTEQNNFEAFENYLKVEDRRHMFNVV